MNRELPLIACCSPLDASPLSDEAAGEAARLFKALSDPARVRLVNLLATSDEPVCVCDLVPVLGLSQGTVSHHLKTLTEAGLLEREPRGRWAFYTLDRSRLAALAASTSARCENASGK